MKRIRSGHATEDDDADGLTNQAEYGGGTDPQSGDSDGDGVGDAADFDATNAAEWFDSDGDGIGNNADVDDDGDGLPDIWESDRGFDPLVASDASGDPDGDGLSNLDEYNAGTDPQSADSDGDGVHDGADALPRDFFEVTDSDGDGVGDVSDPDDDGDGMPDAWEETFGLDPLDPADAALDPDADGIPNLEEYRAGTHPLAAPPQHALASWRFDEGSGSQAGDDSGHEHHGSFTGSPDWRRGVFGGAIRLVGGKRMLVHGRRT